MGREKNLWRPDQMQRNYMVGVIVPTSYRGCVDSSVRPQQQQQFPEDSFYFLSLYCQRSSAIKLLCCRRFRWLVAATENRRIHRKHSAQGRTHVVLSRTQDAAAKQCASFDNPKTGRGTCAITPPPPMTYGAATISYYPNLIIIKL